MPYRPNTPCSHLGCAALVPYGQKYCERHKALHPEEVRSATKRGYGRKWQKASREYLQAHPLCVLGMKKSLSGNTWGGSAWDGKSIYTKKTQEYENGTYVRMLDILCSMNPVRISTPGNRQRFSRIWCRWLSLT